MITLLDSVLGKLDNGVLDPDELSCLLAERKAAIDRLVEASRTEPSLQVSEELKRLAESGRDVLDQLIRVRDGLARPQPPISLLG